MRSEVRWASAPIDRHTLHCIYEADFEDLFDQQTETEQRIQQSLVRGQLMRRAQIRLRCWTPPWTEF